MESEEHKVINLTPTWVTAVQIILAMFENPNADADVRRDGQDELLRLARAMDEHNKQAAH